MFEGSGDEEETDINSIIVQIRNYLILKDKSSNPLIFWKDNKNKFPLLSCIAQEILMIQASSALSERIFTFSGKYNSYQRASMKPEALAALSRLKSARLANII